MENTEVKESKKFNKANLPFFIAVGMFALMILLPIIAFIFYAICSIINPNLATSNISFVLNFFLQNYKMILV